MPSELEKEIKEAFTRQSIATVVAVKDGITKVYNDRPKSYNHMQRTEFYNDVMEVISDVINKLEQDLKS